MILYDKNSGFTRFCYKLRIFGFLLLELLIAALPSGTMQSFVPELAQNRVNKLAQTLSQMFNHRIEYLRTLYADLSSPIEERIPALKRVSNQLRFEIKADIKAEIDDRQRTEQDLKRQKSVQDIDSHSLLDIVKIVERTAAQTGDQFFQTCVRSVAEVLQVRYVLVSTFADSAKTKVHTLALWQGDRLGENFEYDGQAGPWALVLTGKWCYIPAGLQTAFPGAWRWLAIEAESYIGIPLLNASGTVLGYLAVIDTKPMTDDPERELILKIFAARAGAELERTQAEDCLKRDKEMAEAASRAKSAFLTNMSHELRTPLNAILGFAQLMQRDLSLTPNQREALSTINYSGEHLLNLVNDVLELSKIEAGCMVLNAMPFDLHRLLQTLYEMFQERTQSKQLSLQFDLAADLPKYILSAEGKLRQVLINLLGNAVKFTQTGHVTLRVWAEVWAERGTGGTCSLYFEVEDSGCGIAASQIDRLFQPFVQITSGTQTHEGTGLGLAISREFVRLMGGEIQVTSAVHQGTIFRFHIPTTLANPIDLTSPTPDRRVFHLAPGQPHYRILVVDDRQENRELMVRLLRSVGFEIRTAVNGQEAIGEWQIWQPDLIWMDMRMPIMDGYQATRFIRQQEARQTSQAEPLPPSLPPSLRHSLPPSLSPSLHHSPTKIIALTASAFEEQQESIFAAGCDDLVCKPFQERLIFEKMAQHLGVQYLYEELDCVSASRVPTHSAEITSEHLAILPLDWLHQLHQSALHTDEQQIFALLKQLPDARSTVSIALTQLVNSFRCDKIMDLVEPLIESKQAS